ncbi:hypothetical protein GDO86_012226 [Hymenochirus boettgeri]|uniref:G-protein coupled receptors family 1 profile domain-containing protein n=1 Tax=Hymenochirus boettgeri TaxID=247094 RepID=A0A8T2ITP0_9PIPI|nr:hypothetical protein GDO86_012226 [Hymenochirus boettgeri]
MENYIPPDNYSLSAVPDGLLEEEDEDGIYVIVRRMSIICYSVTFILGIVGNGLVIWVAGFKMEKTVNTIWFLNLGFTDFCLCLFLPLRITEWANNGIWAFGWVMCKVVYTILLLNMSVSIIFLMTISVDRCVSVQCPLWWKNPRTSRLATNISVIIWFICLVLSSPYLAFYNIQEHMDNNLSYCANEYGVWSNTTLSEQTWHRRNKVGTPDNGAVLMFLVPFIIILICYCLIIFVINGRTAGRSRSQRPFRIIIAIVTGFFICWFPHHIFPLIPYSTPGETLWKINLVFYLISVILAYFSSCLNPILYYFLNQKCKGNLKNAITLNLKNAFIEDVDDVTIKGTL